MVDSIFIVGWRKSIKVASHAMMSLRFLRRHGHRRLRPRVLAARTVIPTSVSLGKVHRSQRRTHTTRACQHSAWSGLLLSLVSLSLLGSGDSDEDEDKDSVEFETTSLDEQIMTMLKVGDLLLFERRVSWEGFKARVALTRMLSVILTLTRE